MQFTVTPLAIPDVVLVTPQPFVDARGYFMVTHERDQFRQLGLPDFVQDNQAGSRRAGTVRGLHFQRAPHEQAKLVRALRGAIFDVAVDLREGSPTFGRWVAATLTAVTAEQLFVPRGFAHGYCTLEDDTEVAYKCDALYAPSADAGIRFSDPDLAIAWPVAAEAAILSDRDRTLPLLRDAVPSLSGGRS